MNTSKTWIFFRRSWSKSDPGYINIYRGDSRGTGDDYSQNAFEIVSAHEMGHIFGMEDPYKYNNPDEYPKLYDPELVERYSPEGNRSLMGHKWAGTGANNFDIHKVLKAFSENSWQTWK